MLTDCSTPVESSPWIASERSLVRRAVDARGWLYATLLILLTLALRLPNLDHNSLQHHEAWRVNWAHHGTVNQMRWHPPGQLAVSAFIQHAISRSEFWVRLPSLVSGTLAVLLLFAVAKPRIGVDAAALAAVFICAHTNAVFYSRIVKEVPYEMCLTVVLLWAGARLADQFSRRNLRLFLAASILGLLFGFSPILLTFAWGPFVIYAACRDAAQRKANCIALARYGSVFLVLAGVWYVWLAGSEHRRGVTEYFDYTENAWPTAYAAGPLAHWLVDNSIGVVRQLTNASTTWEPRATMVFTATGLLALAGGASLWRRWPMFVGFAALLVVVNIALALARKWPWGEYRTILYLLPLFALFVGAGLESIWRRLQSRALTFSLVALCILYPATRSARATIFKTLETEHIRPILRDVKRVLAPGDAVFIYYAADDATEFYWPDGLPENELYVQPRADRGRFDLFKQHFASLAEARERVWFILAHPWSDEPQVWTDHLLGHYTAAHHFANDSAFAYCFETRATDHETGRRDLP